MRLARGKILLPLAALALAVLACKRGLVTGPQSAPVTGDAQFSLVAVLPSNGNGVAIDLDDNVYVIEYARDPFNHGTILNQSIVKYSKDWNRLFSFGGKGDVDIVAHRTDPDQAAGQFSGLKDLAVDYCGNIFTLEEGFQTCYQCTWQNSRVQKFTPTGSYVSQFWADPTAPAGKAAAGILSGSENYDINVFFKGAKFVETDAEGKVYVLSDNRVNGAASPINILVLDMTQPSAAMVAGPGIVTNPALLYLQKSNALGISSLGFVFVPDTPASGLYGGGSFYGTVAPAAGTQPVTLLKMRFDPAGRPMTGLALTGSAVSGFTKTEWPAGGAVPWGVQLGDKPSCGGGQNYNLAINHYLIVQRLPPVAGQLYEANAGAVAAYAGQVGGQGPAAGEFSNPQEPRFDSRGYLYISDPSRDVVNVFRPSKPL